MDRRIMMLVIGLVFGTGFGFLMAASQGITLDGHDHATGHGGNHDHAAMAPLAIPAQNAPTLAAEVFKDPVVGWNLKLTVTNFAFSPQNASLDHVPGEGHAHVYANGEKLARLYSPWFHLDHLPEGDVTLDVTLNANSHQELAVDGVPLRVFVPVKN
ncbi:hypothetical protein [Ascidiaceihabitans sp.]|uniref:hypothetical protein n=1 Tax=Ascidiaceihabitans sp. TaxID=1872644 RepID=UPI003297417C